MKRGYKQSGRRRDIHMTYTKGDIYRREDIHAKKICTYIRRVENEDMQRRDTRVEETTLQETTRGRERGYKRRGDYM